VFAERRLRLALAAAAAVGVVVVLVALSSGGFGPDRTDAPETRGAEASPSPSVRVARSPLGRMLVDGHGRTLYLFDKDRRRRSVCRGTCARVWPPALVEGRTTAGPGVDRAKLTTIARGGSARQLVYNGHPLYTLSGENRPGATGGEGYLGTWWIVSPRGARIVAPGTTPSAQEY
jgi:predicted lipoprotein with Yx(FWY)xxD motif